MQPPSLRRVAKGVTEVFAPSVLVTVLLPLAAIEDAGTAGLLPALVAVCFVTALPFALVYLAAKKGAITDHHVSARRQRAPVLLGTLVSTIAGLAVLGLLDAPSGLFLMILSVLAGLLSVLVANLVWKLSAHAAVAAFFCIACLALYGPFAATTVLVPACVGWSRIVLRAHTGMQVAGGYIVGVAVGIAYAAQLRLLAGY